MNKIKYIVLLVLISTRLFGQYAFEKYPAPNYEYASDWKETDTDSLCIAEINIDSIIGNDNILIRLRADKAFNNDSQIEILRNGKEINQWQEDAIFAISNGINVFDSVRIADFNGDHLKDVKMVFNCMGNGAEGGLLATVVYLIQKADKSFMKISYQDHMIDGRRDERDMNNDGTYEIITRSFVRYENHTYWLFNLYNIVGNGITCVNKEFDYPIMVQFLYRPNYEITNKISREKMKEFELKKPEFLMINE